VFESYNPRKDKSITLRFSTGEKTPDEIKAFHTLLDQYGYLCFKPNDKLTDKEVGDIDSLDTDLYDNPKTQSQRLRNVLYLLHKQDSQGFNEFKDYYQNHTDKIIEHYKSKLDKETL